MFFKEGVLALFGKSYKKDVEWYLTPGIFLNLPFEFWDKMETSTVVLQALPSGSIVTVAKHGKNGIK